MFLSIRVDDFSDSDNFVWIFSDFWFFLLIDCCLIRKYLFFGKMFFFELSICEIWFFGV